MAQRQSEIIANKPIITTEFEHLPELFSRLGEQTLRLFEAKLNLFTIEVKEDATAFVRRVLVLGGAAIVVVIGFVLVNVALAVFCSILFTFTNVRVNYALGFLSVGFLYLALGGIALLVEKNSAGRLNLTPEKTINELRKDQQWLKKDIL